MYTRVLNDEKQIDKQQMKSFFIRNRVLRQ